MAMIGGLPEPLTPSEEQVLAQDPDAPLNLAVSPNCAPFDGVGSPNPQGGHTISFLSVAAQLEAGALEVDHTPFNISDAVEGAIETVKPLAQEKGLTIRYQQLQQPVQVAGGHRVFHRIIHHLLDNAVKFTESGDVIVDIEILDDELMVSVTDTGIGIEEEFLPRIFEEFSQESTGLERTHQGSGLGLAVSQRLALALGGKIHVSSAKGTGSTFRLVLPRLQAS